MNDYTLSPVFNTRGIEFTDKIESFTIDPEVNENGFIGNSTTLNKFENARGIIKMPKTITNTNTYKDTVITKGGVKPWGIEFKNASPDSIKYLKNITKGYFIVRQERIPTIYAQGLSIAKTKNDYGNIPVINKDQFSENISSGYFTQSFLDNNRRLSKSYITVQPSRIDKKAAIIPEAEIRNSLFNQLFTSSDYKLSNVLYTGFDITLSQNTTNFYLKKAYLEGVTTEERSLLTSKLTMVNDGMSLTTNGEDYFSAKAGDAEQA